MLTQWYEISLTHGKASEYLGMLWVVSVTGLAGRPALWNVSEQGRKLKDSQMGRITEQNPPEMTAYTEVWPIGHAESLNMGSEG